MQFFGFVTCFSYVAFLLYLFSITQVTSHNCFSYFAQGNRYGLPAKASVSL